MIKFYKAIEPITLVRNVNDSDEIKSMGTKKWVKVDDVLKLLNNRIKYLKENGYYPAYGLNSQVQALEDLKEFFIDLQ